MLTRGLREDVEFNLPSSQTVAFNMNVWLNLVCLNAPLYTLDRSAPSSPSVGWGTFHLTRTSSMGVLNYDSLLVFVSPGSFASAHCDWLHDVRGSVKHRGSRGAVSRRRPEVSSMRSMR